MTTVKGLTTYPEFADSKWLLKDVSLIVCRVPCLFQENIHCQFQEGILTLRAVHLLEDVQDTLGGGQALEL